MNKVELMGRLTSDPEVKYSSGENTMAIASWSLAVDRRYSKGQTQVDFIRCKAFGKTAEMLEKYWHKGMKMVLVGHIMTDTYTNKDGAKVHTTDVVADEIYFAESKNAQNTSSDTPNTPNLADELPIMQNPTPKAEKPLQSNIDDFMSIPDGIDEELPFAFARV